MFRFNLKHYFNIDFYKKNPILVINTFFLFFLLLLPYILFGGKLFLGGDDSRLFYAYPQDFLANTQFYSWSNLSSVGWNYPNQDFIPFVTIWSILSIFIRSPMVLTYLAFSLPFILGFVFFQKMISKLILEKKEKNKLIFFIGSIFYIFSPIIINNHFLNPLIPIWLIGLIPATIYYFILYLKDGKFINILKAVVLIAIFSFGLHNIPWILAFLLPLIISLFICSILFKRKDIFYFSKKSFVFFSFIFLSSSFWILPFMATFVGESAGSVTSKVVSSEFTNAFTSAVEATARGMVIHPLLNLYHRQIAFDFDWNLKNIYLSFYDKTLFINFVYILTLFFGLLSFKNLKNKIERKIFIIILLTFIILLYLFTVNIGPLFDFYILLGKIPGFVLFRNAYDKFALGYSFVYAVLLTYCLILIEKRFKPKSKLFKYVLVIFSLVTLINILPIKSTIVSPLWTTKNIFKNINIPDEYLDFMKDIKKTVSPTNNILSIPYGLSLYTVIKDNDSNNVYVGISPVVVFSGVNDISGYLSFNYLPDAEIVNKLIAERNYKELSKILYKHNINYVLVTKNVPSEVKKSYLFISDVLKAQDKTFLNNITDKKILTSKNGNYELYSTKINNTQISSKGIIYKRINRVRYEISFKGVKGSQSLLFNDSYHPGWKLYLTPQLDFRCTNKKLNKELAAAECIEKQELIPVDDVMLLTQKQVFNNTHKENVSTNMWDINPEYIKKNYGNNYYRINKDGTIDFNVTLYFLPQIYFYFGVVISTLTLLSLIFLTYKQNEKDN